MKRTGHCLGVIAIVFIHAQTAAGLAPGGSVRAGIFTGSEVNTPAGNPNADGQGWYRKDMTTLLNYYNDGQERWASAAVRPAGNGQYCAVTADGAGGLTVTDIYWGGIGTAWVYTNSVHGKYEISFDNFRVGSYFTGRIATRANSQEEWTDVSDAFMQNSTYNNVAVTNVLGSGGGFAMRMWNTTAMVSDASGTISGLKVTLLETLGSMPRVSLSADAAELQENPHLQATDGVTITARLDGLSARDTTVNLSFSGTAVYGVDYAVTTNRLLIPAGLNYATLKLRVLDNSAMTGDKSIVITLAALDNASAGEADSVAITLVDDERVLARAGDELRACVFFGDAEDSASGNPNLSGQAWHRKDLATPLKYYADTGATPKWATSLGTSGNSYSHVTTVDATTLAMADAWYFAVGVGWVYTAAESGLYAMSCSKMTGSYIQTAFFARTAPEPVWGALTAVTNGFTSHTAVTNWLNRGDALAIKIYNSNSMAATMKATVQDLKITLLQPAPQGSLLLIK